LTNSTPSRKRNDDKKAPTTPVVVAPCLTHRSKPLITPVDSRKRKRSEDTDVFTTLVAVPSPITRLKPLKSKSKKKRLVSKKTKERVLKGQAKFSTRQLNNSTFYEVYLTSGSPFPEMENFNLKIDQILEVNEILEVQHNMQAYYSYLLDKEKELEAHDDREQNTKTIKKDRNL
jgi:hypothetical protein